MAQTSKINALIDELAVSFARTRSNNDARKLKSAKETAARSAKIQQYVRTNQFEVESTLNGLVEKFSIIGRDDLADALTKRLDELKVRSRSKWTPEILQLFLALSDRPDQKSSLEALELLRPPSPEKNDAITWEELEKEDPLRGDLWEDEAYSSASEDEIVASETLKVSLQSRPSIHSAEETFEAPILTEVVSAHAYSQIKEAQFWAQADLRSSRPQLLTELQVIREVLFMLRGLPTSLFAIDEKNVLIYLAANVMIEQISLSGLNDVLQAFASIGTDVLKLRMWTGKIQTVQLLQAFNAGISKQIVEFDQKIASIEEKFVGQLQISTIVSVLDVRHEIEILGRPLMVLTKSVCSLPITGADFMCLELLYDELGALQAAGDEQCFEVLVRIFFDCLNIYLRPISRWMEQGIIVENDNTFFITTSDKSSAMFSLWHDRFTLKVTNDDKLHAPKFLAPTVKKILNAGKSIVFLQHLHKDTPTSTQSEKVMLTNSSISPNGQGLSLLPFSELLGSALSTWLNSKYGPSSTILKEHLLRQCHLLNHINAMSHVFFSADGTIFQTFADEVLKRFRAQKTAWDDRYVLTELARRSFGTVHGLKVGSLSVRNSSTKHTRSMNSVRALESIILDVNLPWSIQNIIQRSSMSVYQSVFTLLLQAYYAKDLLNRHTFNLRIHHDDPNVMRLSVGIHHSLTWFANVLHSYILETVVHPDIEQLHQQLLESEDVDAMCMAHESFVRDLELKCLLKSNLSPIYDSIVSMLDLAVAFAQSDDARHASRNPKRSTREKHSKSIAIDEDEEEESSSEDEVESKVPSKDAERSLTKLSTAERLRSIQDKFTQLLHFTIAGLRGVSRAGGQVEWEMLAERLEWGMPRKKREFDYV